MNEAEIERVVFTPDRLSFELKDGRMISVPLGFYPTLQRATAEDREHFELYPTSVYWPALDCDIGVEGLLAGAKELPLYARRSGGVRATRDSTVAALREEPPPHP